MRKHQRIAAEPLTEVPVDVVWSDPWVREGLTRETGRLPPASRAVVLLHYFEEMTLVEVAAVLDVSLGTVKSRLAYGLALLRKEFI